MSPINRKKNLAIETVFEEAQMVNLEEKNFKAALINTFKEKKETMLKELKEDMRTISHQRDNINKEINIQIIKRNQMEILLLYQKYSNWSEKLT